MRDTKLETEQKIPILGDLPVLGFLFRNTDVITQKTNLLLILTPYVIQSQNDLRKVFARKMRERQEFLDRYFVFNSEWQPPRDYSRTNGLVERIRQALFVMAEERRFEEEIRPEEERRHQPTEPLDLPVEIAPPGAPAPAKAPTTRRGKKRSSLDVEEATSPREDVPLMIQPAPRRVALEQVE
jgi:general secretion pathway protein D